MPARLQEINPIHERKEQPVVDWVVSCPTCPTESNQVGRGAKQMLKVLACPPKKPFLPRSSGCIECIEEGSQFNREKTTPWVAVKIH